MHHHYTYADLALLNDPSISPENHSLRLTPFRKRDILLDGTIGGLTGCVDQVKEELVEKLDGDPIVVGAEFGSLKYGAILYQLARKFFPSWLPVHPVFADMIHAGNHIAGWHTGGIHGEKPLQPLQFDFPSTYLGGMPYV